MIDTKLLGDARSYDVRQHVQATRDHLAAHLEEAKALRAAMNWRRGDRLTEAKAPVMAMVI